MMGCITVVVKDVVLLNNCRFVTSEFFIFDDDDLPSYRMSWKHVMSSSLASLALLA